MPTTGSPHNVYYADDDTPLDLSAITRQMATSMAAALTSAGIPRVADLDALAVFPGVANDFVRVNEGGAIFRHDGSAWVQTTPGYFSSTATRDSAYAKASGAYRVSTAQVYRSDLNGGRTVELYWPVNTYGPSTAAGWRYEGQFVTIPTATNWNDYVAFARTGRRIDVEVEATRANSTWNSGTAWNSVALALNLPVPVRAGLTRQEALTNSSEYGGFALFVDGNGQLRLQSRWVVREIGVGGWVHGSFFYQSTN